MDLFPYSPSDPSWWEPSDVKSADVKNIVSDGIAAVKAGDLEAAYALLIRAIRLDSQDPTPWIWLSATTDDLDVKRSYLLEALTIDPNHMGARRGLILLDEPENLPTRAQGYSPSPPLTEPVSGKVRTFTCSNCGGRVDYNPQQQRKLCTRCGAVIDVEHIDASSDDYEQGLDHALLTQAGHHWAAADHRLSCQNCGVQTILPAGQRTGECAFCGSSHLVSSPHTEQLLEPQGLIPMRIDLATAQKNARQWLGVGVMVPEDLPKVASNLRLRPAYYPIWSFDCEYTAKWNAEEDIASGLTARSGQKLIQFDDLLVPGTKSITMDELRQIQPFDLKALIEFREEMLAGWHTLLYDISLADASITARGEMKRLAQLHMEEHIASQPTGGYGPVRVTGGGHINQTYRQFLIPIWSGHYSYHGKQYHVIVNGQSGTVGGSKPHSEVKTALLLGLLLTVTVLLAFGGLYWYLVL